MKKIIKAAVPVIAVLALAAVALIVRSVFFAAPRAEEGEIKVQIRLGLEEDIGLLLVEYEADGAEGKGGFSNADRSMLAKDSDDLYWSLYAWQLDAPAEGTELHLRLTAVTEYFEPNYENDYPEEYMVPMGENTFPAEFGAMYRLTVTGSAQGGYELSVERSPLKRAPLTRSPLKRLE